MASINKSVAFISLGHLVDEESLTASALALTAPRLVGTSLLLKFPTKPRLLQEGASTALQLDRIVTLFLSTWQ